MEPFGDLTRHISVGLSATYGSVWKSLRCSDCGNIVCQYNEDGVRSITFSGEPLLDRPGKKLQCAGVLVQYKPKDTFDMLYELYDVVMHAGDIAEIREKVIELARDNQKTSKMCKAKYFIG